MVSGAGDVGRRKEMEGQLAGMVQGLRSRHVELDAELAAVRGLLGWLGEACLWAWASISNGGFLIAMCVPVPLPTSLVSRESREAATHCEHDDRMLPTNIYALSSRRSPLPQYPLKSDDPQLCYTP